VVMDLGRRVCRGIRTMDVLSSHLAFTSRASTRPCVGRDPTIYSSAIQQVSWLIGGEWSGLLVVGG
jgi:hypothetical protein